MDRYRLVRIHSGCVVRQSGVVSKVLSAPITLAHWYEVWANRFGLGRHGAMEWLKQVGMRKGVSIRLDIKFIWFHTSSHLEQWQEVGRNDVYTLLVSTPHLRHPDGVAVASRPGADPARLLPAVWLRPHRQHQRRLFGMRTGCTTRCDLVVSKYPSHHGGWRPRSASSARNARINGRFICSASTVARPVAVLPTSIAPFHRKCAAHACVRGL